jgi:hypothetical protein
MLPITSELHVEVDTLRSIQVLAHKQNEKCLKLKEDFELYDVQLIKFYCIINRAKGNSDSYTPRYLHTF